MTHNSTRRLVSRAAALALFAFVSINAAVARGVTISTVPVGNAGNGNDPFTGNLYGGVADAYRIGTTEVTNAQYVDFLNAKAASDPRGLYNPAMGFDVRGGIMQSGVSGSFTYAAKTDMGNKPVNYVSWYDSIRFANWLNNGQASGGTETGAYTLNGGTPTPSNGLAITRNVGAQWFVPSESEWYKAAYYQPAAQGGDADDYWLYPTASNSAPTGATASIVGDISNPGANVANYLSGADWNGQDGNVTTVGSGGPLSESFYGTSDQGGNVYEWNEALYGGSSRGLRGGAFNGSTFVMRSTFFIGNLGSSFESGDVGFRVATVPEPGTGVLAGLGLGFVVFFLARKRRAFACGVPIATLALCLVAPVPASAGPITVSIDLKPNDQYRLTFVISTMRDATSGNVGDYNTFVTGGRTGSVVGSPT